MHSTDNGILRPISPKIAIGLLIGIFAAVAIGGQVNPSNVTTFVNGTTADADQVNANFAELTTQINDNDTRITALEGGGTDTHYIGVGIQAPQLGQVFGYGGQSGSAAGTALVTIARTGVLTSFGARVHNTVAAGAQLECHLHINGADVGTTITFTNADGAIFKSSGGADVPVNQGDLLTFRIAEVNNVAPGIGTAVSSVVTLR